MTWKKNMRIAFMQDGIAAIIIPVDPNVTLEKLLSTMPEGTNQYIFLDETYDYPPDFRNAWVVNFDTNNVEINFDGAKELTKTRLREEREPLLSKLDIAFQRALETNSDTSAIIAEKQRLRNITNLVDVCTTLDELRNLKC